MDLERELTRLAAEFDVPGVSVARLVDGQVVEAATGVLNARTGFEATPEAVFLIQSVTKVWTATLVLQLVDEGLLALDAPVTTYLPGFRDGVTVRHLLTHTGGFEGDLWAPTTSGDDALERFVEDLVAAARQHSEPGSLYSYCSAGYGVLGRLVEVLRGTTYEAALRRHLAEPLGIEEIAFDADQALGFRTAMGHAAREPSGRQEPLDAWAVMPPSNPAAGNQLAMSARALLALGWLHVMDGLAPDGHPLLSVASARAMREPLVEHPFSPSGSAQGLGWMVSGSAGTVDHGGDTIGVSSMLQVDPAAGTAVAVLTNGEHGGALIKALLGPGRATPTPPARVEVESPGRYVGVFETRVTRHEVRLDGRRLRLRTSDLHEALDLSAAAGLPSRPTERELRPVGNGRFAAVDDEEVVRGSVTFLGDDSGRAQFLHTGRAAPRVG